MRPFQLFRQFFDRQDGAATIEVALLFPLMLWPFLTAMEAGAMQMKRVMFERAVDVSVRQLRLGNPNIETFEDIKELVCSQTHIIGNCLDDLMLEMTPVSVRNFTPPSTRTGCVDRGEDPEPAADPEFGVENQMMMMRFCMLHDPILPGIGIGARLPREPGGGVAIVTTTFYVNEPG